MSSAVLVKGIVASGHRRVTEAAADVLRAGGNAFDAAVAAGFAAAVAEPALTSLGGGGFLLARTAAAKVVLFDFFVDTPGRGLPAPEREPHFLPVTVRFPASEQVFNVGLGSVAVPGNLRGFLHVHQRLGRLPLHEVVAPARDLARQGISLNRWQAYFLGLLRPIMILTPAGSALYERDGSYVAEGDRLTNPELASFLERLPADGARDFYEGALATGIAANMQAGGGLLTAADLAAYEVIERTPLQLDYRGVRLLTNPWPSFGGTLLALSLRLLEHAGIHADFGSAARLAGLVAVMQEVDRLRTAGCLRPDAPPDGDLADSADRVRLASGGTTHVSVIDADGNAASLSTSNGEGSGYIVPGTGIMLNNMMGEDDLHPEGFHTSPPGLRVSSMMSPLLLLDGDGLRLVAGSGGSKRIRTALLQVVTNILDLGKTVRAAVEAPRVHWDGACVQVEPGFPAGVIAALQERFPLNVWDVIDVYFGGVHAVAPNGNAAGDPRRGGSAMVVD